jgi:hypothetical protein
MIVLDWPVDRDGYEWAEDAGAGWVLRRRGGPNRFYRPLEDSPGLFRRFASLPNDRDAILRFTNEFGFITGAATDEFFLLDRFDDQRRRLSYITSILDDDEYQDAEINNRARAAMALNTLLHHGFRMWLDISRDPPAMQLQPTTLYGAMMVQLAQEIAGVLKYRKCKHCPEWFPLGKNQRTTRREFCSDRCRVAWHRHNRIGGAT